ncbi:universal stress protein [Rhodococcus sp. 2H158]
MPVAVVHAATPEGRAALTTAAREAAHSDGTTLVLVAVDDDGPSGQRELESVRTDVTAALGADGWELRTAVHDGDPVGALVDLVERSGAERLVVGSRDRNALGKFLLERRLQRLLLEVPVPVLVVKGTDADAE